LGGNGTTRDKFVGVEILLNLFGCAQDALLSRFERTALSSHPAALIKAGLCLGARDATYSHNIITRPKSFGFVVPAIENRKIMACTFSSLKYPGRAPQDKILLRAFVGGILQPDLFTADDGAMEWNVRAELASLLGVNANPLFTRIWRHPDSMPQYHVGHQERIQRIETALARFPTLALAGSAYHGVGISDCVRTGEEAAERVIERLRRLGE
jgi:oxygen-dependent protoporphyrinogen oxidase